MLMNYFLSSHQLKNPHIVRDIIPRMSTLQAEQTYDVGSLTGISPASDNTFRYGLGWFLCLMTYQPLWVI